MQTGSTSAKTLRKAQSEIPLRWRRGGSEADGVVVSIITGLTRNLRSQNTFRHCEERSDAAIHCLHHSIIALAIASLAGVKINSFQNKNNCLQLVMNTLRLNGSYLPPADKSVTHRAFILAAMADGFSIIKNPLIAGDSMCTINAIRALGVDAAAIDGGFGVKSKGYGAFKGGCVIECGNSGTTARLLAGVLAPSDKTYRLKGDNSLSKRPMGRLVGLLQQMGADIGYMDEPGCLPMNIKAANMHSAHITSPVASAQLKSAILLAACQVQGRTTYIEPMLSRDHTERMLPLFGIDIQRSGSSISLQGSRLSPTTVEITGDISSAAFMVAGALMFPESKIVVSNVGFNPTRTFFIHQLKAWGADIALQYDSQEHGTMYVGYSSLSGGEIKGESAQQMIDELPLAAMLGLVSKDGTSIKDAKELRYKESDRISALEYNLKALGADVEVFDDGITVYPLDETKVKRDTALNAFGDHRIAMMNMILAERYSLHFPKSDLECIKISYPNFEKDFRKLLK